LRCLQTWQARVIFGRTSVAAMTCLPLSVLVG
jgi:hypothetical protein